MGAPNVGNVSTGKPSVSGGIGLLMLVQHCQQMQPQLLVAVS